MRINLYRLLQNEESELKLYKEKGYNYVAETKGVNNPYEIARMMNILFHLEKQAEEYAYLLAYNKSKIVT